MKVFYMSVRYWAGCIFIMTVLTAIWGLVKLDGWTVILSFIVLFIGGIASFPLILPCMWLLRITAKLPYPAPGKTWWFAAMFSLVYMAMVFIVRPMFHGYFGPPRDNTLFYFAAASVFTVTWLSRKDLENLYKQQTNQQ
jgi:hypothetical protein